MISRLLQRISQLVLPQPLYRSPEEQQAIDAQTRQLSLYHYPGCPYCHKVRRSIRRLSLNIELRDIHRNREWDSELKTEGGLQQVPCLRIDKGGKPTRWLYESSDIVRYLEQRYST